MLRISGKIFRKQELTILAFFLFISAIICFSASAPALAEEGVNKKIVTINDTNNQYDLVGEMSYFIDPMGRTTIDDLSGNSEKFKFTPL
jgi:hypothetical protein